MLVGAGEGMDVGLRGLVDGRDVGKCEGWGLGLEVGFDDADMLLSIVEVGVATTGTTLA